MAAPKKKTSRARTRRRFATYAKRRQRQLTEKTHLVACGNCSELRLTHHVCSSCGFYRGKQVLDMEKAKKSVHTIEA